MDHTENTATIIKEMCLLIRCLAIDVLLLSEFACAGVCLLSRCLAMVLQVTALCQRKTSIRHKILVIFLWKYFNSDAYLRKYVHVLIGMQDRS
jgi:hypothetical protein